MSIMIGYYSCGLDLFLAQTKIVIGLKSFIQEHYNWEQHKYSKATLKLQGILYFWHRASNMLRNPKDIAFLAILQ